MSAKMTTLHDFEAHDPGEFEFDDRASRLAELTNVTYTEAEAVAAVEYAGFGVREFARKTGRSPGTVGNLLSRAREKTGGEW